MRNEEQTRTARAPAKINLGLEVLGRRPDGYHELVTILQAIDLCDVFEWKPNAGPFHYSGPPDVPAADDLVVRALHDVNHTGWTGTLSIRKRIPAAAGLGGGSSDAALALKLAHPYSAHAGIQQAAALLGSDVPFFLRGGTALAEGTGTTLTSLRRPSLWVLLVTAPLSLPDKTRRLYRALTPDDLSDGSRVRSLVSRLEDVIQFELPNPFLRQMRAFPEVDEAWEALSSVAPQGVHLSGAGPTLFALYRAETAARAAASALPPGIGRVAVARTLEPEFDAYTITAIATAMRGKRRAL